jgi:uncharacterized protein
MIRIGLISDTHGFLDPNIAKHFSGCNEIWHGGDFGSVAIAEELMQQTGLPLRGVYGNIDGYEVRSAYPEDLSWTCESVPVFMTHIGGYPGRYAPGVKNKIVATRARLFISGHSHILKIMFDKDLDCLHMNPGAAGKQGWQKVRTIIRFSIDNKEIKDCEVVELGKK